MQVSPRDRILELECGEGEMSVRLAAGAPEGLLVAMDRDGDRMRQARVRARDLDNTLFLEGGAGAIPWQENFFSKAVSHGLPQDPTDVFRVLSPGALLFVVVIEQDVPGAAAALSQAGFSEVETLTLNGNHLAVVGKKPA